MNVRALPFIFYFSLLFNYAHTEDKIVIFDLHGVLVKRSTLSLVWNAGIFNFFGLYNPIRIEAKLFTFLRSIESLQKETPRAFYKHKFEMPQIMCDWLMGLKTSQEIKAIVEQQFKDYPNWCDNQQYIKIAQGITNVMFTPELHARIFFPIKNGIKLLKKVRKKVDKIILLSNWDAESFGYLLDRKDMKEIFNNCNGWIISGIAHYMKPDPQIFECLFQQFSIDPDTDLIVYIDDQKENITAAKNLNKKNMHCMLCNNFNFRAIKRELKTLGML